MWVLTYDLDEQWHKTLGATVVVYSLNRQIYGVNDKK